MNAWINERLGIDPGLRILTPIQLVLFCKAPTLSYGCNPLPTPMPWAISFPNLNRNAPLYKFNIFSVNFLWDVMFIQHKQGCMPHGDLLPVFVAVETRWMEWILAILKKSLTTSALIAQLSIQLCLPVSTLFIYLTLHWLKLTQLKIQFFSDNSCFICSIAPCGCGFHIREPTYGTFLSLQKVLLDRSGVKFVHIHSPLNPSKREREADFSVVWWWFWISLVGFDSHLPNGIPRWAARKMIESYLKNWNPSDMLIF